MLAKLLEQWQDRPTDDEVMIQLSREVQPLLWQAVLDRLGETGQVLLGTYHLLFLYELMVRNRLDVGPQFSIDVIRAELKKTLEQAISLVRDLGLSNVSSAYAASGPGGIRTHDPHNADTEEA